MSLDIAIVGAGAIGGYLGVKLALSGCQVTFIARGENLKAIKAQGMALISEDGSRLEARDVSASSMEEARQYDYCLLYTSPSPRDRTRSRMPSSA